MTTDELSLFAQELGQADREDDLVRMLASLVTASHEFIGIADLEGNALFVNEAGRKLVGLPDLQAVRSTKIVEYFAAPDQTRVLEEVLPAVRQTGFWAGGLTFRNFATGALVPVLYNIFPVCDASGAIAAYGTVTRDLTETKRAEEKITTLAREAEHRSKNLLASVQAIVNLSNADTRDGLKHVIEGRIQALANVHSLFVETRWVGAELSSVAGHELAPYLAADRKRARIDGPSTLLNPNTAQSIAVALHELATNAAKYGSLSNGGGRIDLTWQHGIDGQLLLRWEETGGPPVDKPTRRGFGSRVVEQMIRQLPGTVRFDWNPDGLVCEIVFRV